MRLTRIDLAIVRLPLVRVFRTSSSVRSTIQHILVRVETAEGVEGWGECSSPADPYYCPETTGTCWHILEEFLVPAVLGEEWETLEQLSSLFRRIKGNQFARSGLETACWDALARQEGRPLASLLGGTRHEIAAGVSLGIEADLARTFDQIDQYRSEGYRRIKLKIAPGHDVVPVARVRNRYPELPLQVDANSAYTLNDIETLRELDRFDLLLIEQPLAHDDIIDHAALQSQLKTPVCLDESIHHVDDARKAVQLGACRTINIKVGRVGGLLEAKRIHDYCAGAGVPVWCGGMHEFGVGRAVNVALASLAGFSLPGDVSGSDKYYAQDLVEPAIRASDGLVPVNWDRPGIGPEPVPERVREHTVRSLTLRI